LDYPHQPVLEKEVVKHLVHFPDGLYVDGTSGSGGHAVAVAAALGGEGRLICLDRDPVAVQFTRRRLGFLGERLWAVQANYADLDRILKRRGFNLPHGILLDLGMSSYQLEQSGRGFSFTRDETLDMRMDPGEDLTAKDLVNQLSLRELEKVLRDYGEERRAKAVARAIVRGRRKRPIEKASELAALVKSVFPPSRRFQTRHPATRVFQALRIAVNRELENLEVFLGKVPSLLERGGRLCILSYHSLEDRKVKRAMADWERGCTCPPDFPRCVCGNRPVFRRLFKKALRPSPEEIEKNPRARSALLRVAERV